MAANGDDSRRQRNSNARKDTTSTVALHDAYTTLGKPDSFGGAWRPFIGRFGRCKAECYLRTQEAYTLHKQVKRRFCVARRTRKVSQSSTRQISSNCWASWTTTTRIATCWVLTCIDVFTKRAWVIPLRSETGRKVTEVFGKILASSDRLRPRMLQTDKGTEFINATFQRMLMDIDVHWYNTEN